MVNYIDTASGVFIPIELNVCSFGEN